MAVTSAGSPVGHTEPGLQAGWYAEGGSVADVAGPPPVWAHRRRAIPVGDENARHRLSMNSPSAAC